MMRPDIDRVEMQCEGEHHHGVLRARRESDDHVGDPKRKQRATTISANAAATATATAKEPKAAPR